MSAAQNAVLHRIADLLPFKDETSARDVHGAIDDAFPVVEDAPEDAADDADVQGDTSKVPFPFPAE